MFCEKEEIYVVTSKAYHLAVLYHDLPIIFEHIQWKTIQKISLLCVSNLARSISSKIYGSFSSK